MPMFRLKYANTFDAAVFLKYEVPESAEDYYEISDNIFCVADGVTRDPIDGILIPYPTNKKELEYLNSKYPNPSGALKASKICVKEFIKYIKNYSGKITKKVVNNAVNYANEKIWEINKDRKIDYVVEDLYCCEAVGGVIIDDYLYCFSIGDCHITLLNKDLEEVFTTINNHLNYDNYERDILKKECPEKCNWNTKEYRYLVRSKYRNNPRATI